MTEEDTEDKNNWRSMENPLWRSLMGTNLLCNLQDTLQRCAELVIFYCME